MKWVMIIVTTLLAMEVYGLDTMFATNSPENYVTVNARGNWLLERHSFASDQILVFMYNNNAEGYNIGIISENGGFKHETVSSTIDGALLQLAWSCDSPNDVNGNTLIADGGSSINHSPVPAQAGVNVDILEIIEPDVATAGTFSICEASLVAHESTAELYAGNYSDTITFTITNR